MNTSRASGPTRSPLASYPPEEPLVCSATPPVARSGGSTPTRAPAEVERVTSSVGARMLQKHAGTPEQTLQSIQPREKNTCEPGDGGGPSREAPKWGLGHGAVQTPLPPAPSPSPVGRGRKQHKFLDFLVFSILSSPLRGRRRGAGGEDSGLPRGQGPKWDAWKPRPLGVGVQSGWDAPDGRERGGGQPRGPGGPGGGFGLGNRDRRRESRAGSRYRGGERPGRMGRWCFGEGPRPW
jgi:hypothetical protein